MVFFYYSPTKSTHEMFSKRSRDDPDDPICHGCGRIHVCPGCLEHVSYINGVVDMQYHRKYMRLKDQDVAGRVRELVTTIRKDLDDQLRQFTPTTQRAIQLTNVLMDAATAITAMASDEVKKAEDKEKLFRLNQHAWDGMAMVNGYEDDEQEDPADGE